MKFCDNCGRKINDSDIKYYTSQSGLELIVCEKCLNNYLGKTRREKIKKDKVVKLSIVLVIIIILLGVTSVGGLYILDSNNSSLKKEKQELMDELILTQSQLVNANSQLNATEQTLELNRNNLQSNTTALQELKTGDKYHLHDPLFNEVTQFIQDDNSENEKTLIDNAKNKGLQCVLVEVEIVGSTIKIVGSPSSDSMVTIIGFNTVDRGMVYYESTTDYRVSPVVGKKYADCVEGTPYWSGFLTDDTITGIITIW